MSAGGETSPRTTGTLLAYKKAGFAITEAPETGDVPTPRGLISFVLVHNQIGAKRLLATIEAIRNGGPEVRFSPIVMIADECDVETVLHFVHLGVDDVISLPEKREVLTQGHEPHNIILFEALSLAVGWWRSPRPSEGEDDRIVGSFGFDSGVCREPERLHSAVETRT